MKSYVITFDQTYAMSVMALRALQALLSLLWHLHGSILLGDDNEAHAKAKTLLESCSAMKTVPYSTLSMKCASHSMLQAFLATHDGVGIHCIELH